MFLFSLFVLSKKLKMTFIVGAPVTFGYVFPLFQHYWLTYHQYDDDEINRGQFEIIQQRVFERLEKEYKIFKWDEKELEWVCSRIRFKDFMVDPLNFILNSIAYIVQAKSYYFLESII